jgi:hypothetical protein
MDARDSLLRGLIAEFPFDGDLDERVRATRRIYDEWVAWPLVAFETERHNVGQMIRTPGGRRELRARIAAAYAALDEAERAWIAESARLLRASYVVDPAGDESADDPVPGECLTVDEESARAA